MEKLYKANFYILIIIISTYIFPSIAGLPLTPAALFYVPFWLLLLVFTCPKIFISKGFLIAYSFLILHLLYILFSFYPSDKNNTRYMLDEVVPMMFSFSVLEYFQRVNRFYEFKVIINLIFYGSIITGITSIISLMFFPQAARDLAGALSNNAELSSFYMLIGIANFYFYIYLAIISSVFLFTILYIKNNLRLRSYFILIYIMTFLAILFAQYAATLMLFFLGIGLILVYSYIRNIFSLIFLLSIGVLLYLNLTAIASTMRDLATAINLENLSPKIESLASVVEGKEMFVSDSELVFKEIYEELKLISLNSFKSNMATGGGKIGDHTFWYDILGNYGLVGLIPWIFVFYYLIRNRINLFAKQYKPVYLVGIIMLIFIGFHKPFRNFECFPFIAILFPAVIFKVQDLLQNQKNRLILNNAK